MARILVIADDHDPQRPPEDILRREGFTVLESRSGEDDTAALLSRYRRLVEQSSDLISEIDGEGRFLFLSERYRRVLGFAPEDLLGRPAAELLHPDDLIRAGERYARLKDELKESVDVWRFRHRDGSYRTFECRAVVSGEGSAATTVVIAHDISERLEAEKRRSVSEARFAAFMAHLPGAVFIKNSADILVFCNERYAAMLGTTPEKVVGRSYAFGLPEELRKQYRRENHRVLTDGDILQTESRFVLAGNPTYWLTCKFPLHVDGERFVGAVSIDITSQKLAESRLARTVEERDRLMTEINHRIKNNLQMVGSMINLKGEVSGVDFSDIRQQIAAIRIVHENLTGRLGEGEIEVAGYLDDLLDNLARIQIGDDTRIVREFDSVCLDADTVLHIGLIVNELVINAFKHGREPGRRLTVRVFLKLDDSGDRMHLVVGNDGRRFPGESAVGERSTLGMKLIQALSRQLGGEMRLEREPETRFSLEFIPPSPLCAE